MDQINGWDAKNGEIIVYPVHAYRTAVFGGMVGAVRFEFARNAGESKNPVALQLNLTLAQLEELQAAFSLMIAGIKSPDSNATKQ